MVLIITLNIITTTNGYGILRPILGSAIIPLTVNRVDVSPRVLHLKMRFGTGRT